jgi:hypothetical protein
MLAVILMPAIAERSQQISLVQDLRDVVATAGAVVWLVLIC